MNRPLIGAISLVAAGLLSYGTYRYNYDAWVAFPAAHKPVLDLLKDPASAQFREERFGQSGALCGEVNAKNGMGGYVGFKKFISLSATQNYIEGDGVLGKWQHNDVITKLEKETERLKMYVKWKNEGIDLPKPSDTELSDLANKDLFEARWKEYCDFVTT